MNIYFVFEGKTESIVYKRWLSKLLPNLIEVESYDAVISNNYYYESDMGIPSCYRVAANAIQEINENPKYDYLVLCIDADRSSIDERRSEASNQIQIELLLKTYKSLPNNCKLIIIIQKVCIETWFLGNKKMFVKNPQYNQLLKDYINYFDVSQENPENLASDFMQNEENTLDIFGYKTKALFHEGYLKQIFKERNLSSGNNLTYSKSRPKEVQEEYYLNEIVKRTQLNSDHLISFQDFLAFCMSVIN